MSGVPHTTRIAVLMFTDIVGSVELKSRLGTPAYARLLERHDELFKVILTDSPRAEVLQDTGDGYFAAFDRVSDAVRHALRFQDAMHREPWGAEPLTARVGIHFGELVQIRERPDAPDKVVGIAADLASRLMSLATGGQILLSRAAFDEGRQFVGEYPCAGPDGQTPALRWMAHGDYMIQGIAEPVAVFEVGGAGVAPLAPPPDSAKAHRLVVAEEILGWRPAVGLAVPQTPEWVLEGKLGEGTFGEVWLARHRQLKQHRVFKFCFDAARLESFKRELTLFRLLRDALGDRPDIARLHDVCLDRPPFFLASEYAPEGNLVTWAESRGGLANVPLATRLDIVARTCDAVAAAHSVGVLHKDIKPSNILIRVGRGGEVRPQLADFGIGLLTDRGQLAARHITEAGLTGMGGDVTSYTGTRMYEPPESLAGRPFTTQGDVYALGVLLYQMAVADLDRPLALGWERGVEDELLREDIAACVDGDRERRIHSAAEVGSRLRGLDERRRQRAAAARERDAAARRRTALRVTSAVALAAVVLAGAGAYTYVQQQRLSATRREVAWGHAATGLEQGVASHFAGRGQQSRAAFVRARESLLHLGVSPLAAEVGIFRSLREFEAPINTIAGHPDGVMAVAWLPDGTRFVSAGDDGVVRLWDARTGRLLRPFAAHDGLVAAVAVSPDGLRMLSGGADRTVRLWDLAGGQHKTLFTEPTAHVRGVAFSPDGRRALSGSGGKDPSLRLWDLDTGTQLRLLTAPGAPQYYGVAFSPDGRQAMATTYASDIWAWDLDRQAAPLRFQGHTGYVIGAAFSPDGRRIVSASFDKTLRLWDARTGKPVGPPLAGHTEGVRGVAFVGGDGNRALSCGMDGTLKLWDLDSGKSVRTFAGHTDGVRGVAVSPDGTRAVSGGVDPLLRVWSLRPNSEVPETEEDGGATVTTLAALTPGGEPVLVSGNAAGVVTLRDATTLRTLRTLAGHDGPVECATPLADGRRLFTADHTGRAILWDIGRPEPLQSFPPRVPRDTSDRIRGDDWCHTSVAPDGALAISSTADDHHFDVWSPESGKTLRTIGPHAYVITCLAISPDAKHALAGDLKGDLYHWDLGSGQLLFKSPDRPKPGRLNCVTFSADGKTALAGGHDLVVRLWDLPGRREVRAFEGHTLMVRTAGFGRGGATVFSAGGDQTLRVFDAESGRAFDLGAHFPTQLHASAVIPPGDAIAVASGPTITVWNVWRAKRYVEDEPRLEAARAALAANADDPAALQTLGEWYAFRGDPEWAVDLLERARAAGARDVSPLTLARCYWQLERPADAEREYRVALARNPALADHVQLCVAALAGPTPASRPTTLPVASKP